MISEKRVKRYCCEPFENIEGYVEAIADKTQSWDCHHRLEVQGEFTNSVKLLKKCKMYWHRPASELIFLTHSDHQRLHSKAERRGERAGNKMLGKKAWNNGTVFTWAAECPGPGWVRGRIASENAFGKFWWNNGIEQRLCKECPGPEWARGMLKSGELREAGPA